MFMSFQSILDGIQGSLSAAAPTISVILIILAGFAFGFAQLQPAEARGKYTSIAISLFVGGVIVAAVALAASSIALTSEGLLK
jgi:hypothetical protein